MRLRQIIILRVPNLASRPLQFRDEPLRNHASRRIKGATRGFPSSRKQAVQLTLFICEQPQGGGTGMAMAPLAHSISQQKEECIQACLDCARICNTCADDMIGMQHDAVHDLMVRCIRLCRDCADICLLSAQWMGRASVFAVRLCALCAEVCDLCAGLCEQHAPHHPLCGDCAKECRRCAGLCHQMVVQSVPNPAGASA